jgi:mannose-6-phosphate isomerase-like protein (cupin superfamily)
MKGFIDDIAELAGENTAFRRVVYTGQHMQQVLMTLKPGEEIGTETHQGNDQFFRVEKGRGEAWIDGKRSRISKEDAIFVPAGALHNIVNTGSKPLRFYTLYSPPHHQDGIVRETRAEAISDPEHFDGRTTETRSPLAIKRPAAAEPALPVRPRG